MGNIPGVTGARFNLINIVLVWEPFQLGEVYFGDRFNEDSVGCFPSLVHTLMA